MKFSIFNFKFSIFLFVSCLLVSGLFSYLYFSDSSRSIPLSLSQPTPTPVPPLLKYSIPNLTAYDFQKSPIIIERELSKTDQFTAYLFSYVSTGKKITGQLNVPVNLADQPKIIVMIRGYADPITYVTGLGTKNAAASLAQNGYVTIAPDFLGYGESDLESTDTWEARLIKPINVVELIKSLQTNGVPRIENSNSTIKFTSDQIGLWGHSNGGQIALTVMEIYDQPLPVVLWAPVTAPFPYSVLYYSDENEDEGKEARAWVSIFEKTYDAYDFSLTKHLDLLKGNIEIHHGTIDEAAPYVWSLEFEEKIADENKRREKLEDSQLQPVEFKLYSYSGADHNLQPAWGTAMTRTREFFDRELSPLTKGSTEL